MSAMSEREKKQLQLTRDSLREKVRQTINEVKTELGMREPKLAALESSLIFLEGKEDALRKLDENITSSLEDNELEADIKATAAINYDIEMCLIQLRQSITKCKEAETEAKKKKDPSESIPHVGGDYIRLEGGSHKGVAAGSGTHSISFGRKDDSDKDVQVKASTPVEMETIEMFETDQAFVENMEIKKAPPSYKKVTKNVYSMDRKFPRGQCLIINNYEFPGKERHGSKYDVLALENVFRKLHFEVKTKQNLTKQGMLNILKEYSKMDYTHFDALVVIIMSHGNKLGPVGVDDGRVPLQDIYQSFNSLECETLRNKPKMFFFQICRGEPKTEARAQVLLSDEMDDATGASAEISDMLLSFSTVEGYKSHRRTVTGSIYIQSLRECLCELASTTHLRDILDEVNKKVQQYYVSRKRQVTQVPSYTNNGFNKKLYFNP